MKATPRVAWRPSYAAKAPLRQEHGGIGPPPWHSALRGGRPAIVNLPGAMPMQQFAEPRPADQSIIPSFPECAWPAREVD